MARICEVCGSKIVHEDEELSSTGGSSLSGKSESVGSSSTHPPSIFTPAYYENFQEWCDKANEASQQAFPVNLKPRNSRVGVLLVSFEDDDLGVTQEIEGLENVFRTQYRYETEIWKIPKDKSRAALSQKLNQFRDEYCDDERSKTDQLPLLIFYYAGHAQRPIGGDNTSLWCSKRKQPCAQLNWTALQPILFDAPADVLLLLDCCFASSSMWRAGTSVSQVGAKETIAACGPSSVAAGVGQRSFTIALIQELELQATMLSVLTVAALAGHLLNTNHRLPFQPSYAPSHRTDRNSIALVPFPPLDPGGQEISSPSTSSTSSTVPEVPLARILVAIYIKGNPYNELGSLLRNADSVAGYLRNEHALPTSVTEMSIERMEKVIKIEGVYQSNSTVVMASIPPAVWYLLPENPACKFVALVRGTNMMNRGLPPLENGGIEFDVSPMMLSPTVVFSTGSRSVVSETDSGLDMSEQHWKYIGEDFAAQGISRSDTPEIVISAPLSPQSTRRASYAEDSTVTSSYGHAFREKSMVLPSKRGSHPQETLENVSGDREEGNDGTAWTSSNSQSAKSCLACVQRFLNCDGMAPCSSCIEHVDDESEVNCNYISLSKQWTLLFPDMLTESMHLKNVNAFMNANATHWIGKPFDLPLTVGFGEDIHVCVREVDLFSLKLLEVPGFPYDSQPNDQDSEYMEKVKYLKSPPLIPWYGAQGAPPYEQLRDKVTDWMRTLNADTAKALPWYLFSGNDEAWERTVLQEICKFSEELTAKVSRHDGESQVHAEALQRAINWSLLNELMTTSFIVPEAAVDDLYRHLKLPWHESSMGDIGDMVSPRAVNKIMKAILLPALQELARYVFRFLHRLLETDEQRVSMDSCQLAFSFVSLGLIVVSSVQTAIIQKTKVDSSTGTNAEIRERKIRARELVTELEVGIADWLISLFIWKYVATEKIENDISKRSSLTKSRDKFLQSFEAPQRQTLESLAEFLAYLDPEQSQHTLSPTMQRITNKGLARANAARLVYRLGHSVDSHSQNS